MNSAAVIGRQLRQQNTGRAALAAGGGAGGLSAASAAARARAPSHCNLIPPSAQQHQQQQQQHQQGPHHTPGQAQTNTADAKEETGSRWTLRCVWEACKALSGGILLMVVGTTMCVVGFYAEHLATSQEQRHNATVVVVDRTREAHLHNMSFAGPAIMGLGGIFIVAACVLTFEAKDRPHHRVVPVDERKPSAAEVLIPVLAKTPHTSNHLTVPGMAPASSSVWTTRLSNGTEPGPSEPPRSLVLPCSAGARTSLSSTTTFLLSPRYEEHFLPSPADLQIQDPDGCDTPDSLVSVRLELYARYPRTPKLFASVESDGLSDDSDDDEMMAATPSYVTGGLDEDQVVPLLGRCSPQDLVRVPPRRDGPKRFPLLRQSAAADG
ncbi:unnamed protein product, partial [Ixodes hexagonus]